VSKDFFLVITNIYPPGFAPRVGFMLKYLANEQLAPSIITRPSGNDVSFQSLSKFIPTPTYVKVGKMSFRNRIEAIIYNTFYPIFYFIDVVKIFIHAIRLQKNSNHNFEFIFCSISDHIYMAHATFWIAKFISKPFILDFRDVYEQQPFDLSKESCFNKIISKRRVNFTLRKRNMLLSKADQVITVSSWLKNVLLNYNENVKVVYNGYDSDMFYPIQIKTDKFRIVYTGSIYPKIYDLDFFFTTIYDLIYQQRIEFNLLCVDFYIPLNNISFIKDHPKFNHIKSVVNFHDYVDTSEVNKILNSASILLLFNKKCIGEFKGLNSTSTKFYEYISVNKPIICLSSDEAELEMLLNTYNLGLAARTTEDAISFIIDKFNEWKTNGFTALLGDSTYVKQFSRNVMASSFYEIFSSISSSK
jgi:hypothetical protein